MGEISILDIFKIIFRRIWAIIIAAVLCGAVAFVYCTMFATPTYQAKSSVIGSNGNIAVDYDVSVPTSKETVQSGDLAASLALSDTYVVMLTKMPAESQEFIDKLTDEGLFDIYQNSSISISPREETLIIDISVVSTDRKAAQEIANIYAECSSSFVSEYNIGMIKTLSKARDTVQTSPNTVKTVFFAVLLGVIIVAFIAVYIDMSDKTINGEDDVRANYDIPILGSVPDFQTISKGGKK